MNATAFEIREAEGAQVAKVFEFKGSSTKSFLASPKSFLFNKATERKLSVRIEVEESKPLGIATWRTTGAVRNLEVITVDEPDSPPEKDDE